jgi:hypothetical protein
MFGCQDFVFIIGKIKSVNIDMSEDLIVNFYVCVYKFFVFNFF